jgi:hypothetical protein
MSRDYQHRGVRDPVFTIRLPQALRERANEAAEAEGISVGEWLRRAAEERLAQGVLPGQQGEVRNPGKV